MITQSFQIGISRLGTTLNYPLIFKIELLKATLFS